MVIVILKHSKSMQSTVLCLSGRLIFYLISSYSFSEIVTLNSASNKIQAIGIQQICTEHTTCGHFSEKVGDINNIIIISSPQIIAFP